MATELPKVYNPKVAEDKVNALWQSRAYFHAELPAHGSDTRTYTIVIPPPNVTAALHLGHALNNTLQDILIRFKRMQGRCTLWMPGTDHAGIATQTVVDKRLQAEGQPALKDYKKREAEGGNGRAEFIEKVQAWKDEYEAMILGQLKAMGCSCDWARTRFTMDEVCAKAVRTNFFNLFKDGLIYRGKRLVNWDPATQTVLADDEVEHETVQGFFWYMRYPLVESVAVQGQPIEHVTVATTRPETMLGDTAVAMNSADPRASVLVGRQVRLPIVGRIIPIIADEHVVLPNPDSDDEKARFSTGFLKVTPAHDPDDWQIGQRHNLPVINVMAPDGSISHKYDWIDWNDIKNPDVESLIGMDRFEAREAVVEWFRQEGLLEDIREYTHEVGHSYRSHVPIEPYLSDQWYIAVKKPIEHLASKFGSGMIDGTDVPVNSLAGLALKPLLDGRLRFFPERYARTYQTWLENLRDWPISRQLWWGHRIPVWQCKATEGIGYAHSKTTKPDQYRIELQKRLDHFSNLMDTDKYHVLIDPDPKRDEFFICSSSIDADKAFNKILSLRESEYPQGKGDGQEIPFSTIPDFPSIEADTAANEILEMLHTVEQDPDVLDTWFSSALWPFSTLGWPDASPDLNAFYPGDVLCTAREIITLWVSRMVMMGQYCVGDIPFRDVYIHAMIQDGLGRKMSKSLGNGIDPLVAIDSHGADAMRFTLASMTTDTQDIRMPVELITMPDGRQVNTSPKFDIGRNFCNKLWNASRFAMMNLEDTDPAAFAAHNMDTTDRWILSRLAATITELTESLEHYKFSEPLNLLYRFFWNDLCDWYLEWAKPKMSQPDTKAITQNVLAFVLDQTLRMLHPFLPFITEEIFQNLNAIVPRRQLADLAEAEASAALTVALWPMHIDYLVDHTIEQHIETVQAVIKTIREIRNDRNIPPVKPLAVSVKAPQEYVDILTANQHLVTQLGVLERFEAGTSTRKPSTAAIGMAGNIEVYVHGAIDPVAERQRLEKQRQQLAKNLQGMEAKLANENFISKAKPEVVEQARAKFVELQEQYGVVEKHLAKLDNT